MGDMQKLGDVLQSDAMPETVKAAVEEGDKQDPWQWWRRALGNEPQPVHENEYHWGYWRMRQHKDGRWVAVATWQDDSDAWKGIVYLPDGRAEYIDVEQRWTHFCQAPVTHAAFEQYKTDRVWPDDAPAIGDNQPPDDVAAELEAERELVDEFLAKPVETKEQADKVGVWATRLTKLAKRADDERKAEKQPHLDAGRAVDAEYQPVVKGAKELAARLKKHVEPFLIAQAEQAETDRDEFVGPYKPRDLSRDVAEARQAGRKGAKVSLRDVKVGVIEDYDKALVALKDYPEMRSLVDQLVQRAARAGHELDGVKITVERKAA